jgi:hypothetical protein
VNEILSDLARSPAQYPMALDLTSGEVLLVEMEEADYRASSFLDERIVARDKRGQRVALADIERALVKPRSACPLHFIFHAGHVGSTLLSRLLDETGRVLSLREPLPLRTIAEAYDTGTQNLDAMLELLLRLWERGFDGNDAVVLKATSATQRLSEKLLSRRPEARAVALNVSAESYLATTLAAPNSAIDLNAHGPERMHRLGKLGAAVPRPSTLGELAAMSWLAEKLTQVEMERMHGARVMAVDFDAMLLSLEETLNRVADHFGVGLEAGRIAQIARSPVLARYSKAPEHAYSAALRTGLLNEARARYANEIRAAIAWLEMVAAGQGRIAALL